MLNRLEMLRVFCAAADAGSFKGAAMRLGISPQAVTRAIHELEALQGELLFHRNTRRIQITAFGEALAARARACVGELDALFASAKDQEQNELAGVVRLTAPSSIGRLRVLPVLTALGSAHPQLQLDVRLNDQIVDVVDERIDIGLRIGFPRDNRFVVRAVAKVHFRVVGTPALIARVGLPASIAELDRVPTTGMVDRNTGRAWPWLFADGEHAAPAQPAFMCDDAEAEAAAVLAGIAFGQIPDFLADQHIAAGRLVPVLQDLAPDPWDLYLYRPQRGPVPARIRLVFDALVSALSVP
ncbi:LysR family transcriptional regulator [Niveibacterium sp.]|uniref:LysR family transcriptional regulator n=1 Tax=Niveibacterium sp. TaxID=2017444 RepID=UPI0035B0B499